MGKIIRLTENDLTRLVRRVISEQSEVVVNDGNFNKIIGTQNKIVFIDFWATWCGPCRAMGPVLDELKAELGERVRILKIDVDQNTDLAVQMKVMGVPTFMIYKNGQRLWHDAGTFTKEALKKKIEDVENQ